MDEQLKLWAARYALHTSNSHSVLTHQLTEAESQWILSALSSEQQMATNLEPLLQALSVFDWLLLKSKGLVIETKTVIEQGLGPMWEKRLNTERYQIEVRLTHWRQKIKKMQSEQLAQVLLEKMNLSSPVCIEYTQKLMKLKPVWLTLISEKGNINKVGSLWLANINNKSIDIEALGWWNACTKEEKKTISQILGDLEPDIFKLLAWLKTYRAYEVWVLKKGLLDEHKNILNGWLYLGLKVKRSAKHSYIRQSAKAMSLSIGQLWAWLGVLQESAVLFDQGIKSQSAWCRSAEQEVVSEKAYREYWCKYGLRFFKGDYALSVEKKEKLWIYYITNSKHCGLKGLGWLYAQRWQLKEKKNKPVLDYINHALGQFIKEYQAIGKRVQKIKSMDSVWQAYMQWYEQISEGDMSTLMDQYQINLMHYGIEDVLYQKANGTGLYEPLTAQWVQELHEKMKAMYTYKTYDDTQSLSVKQTQSLLAIFTACKEQGEYEQLALQWIYGHICEAYWLRLYEYLINSETVNNKIDLNILMDQSDQSIYSHLVYHQWIKIKRGQLNFNMKAGKSNEWLQIKKWQSEGVLIKANPRAGAQLVENSLQSMISFCRLIIEGQLQEGQEKWVYEQLNQQLMRHNQWQKSLINSTQKDEYIQQMGNYLNQRVLLSVLSHEVLKTFMVKLLALWVCEKSNPRVQEYKNFYQTYGNDLMSLISGQQQKVLDKKAKLLKKKIDRIEDAKVNTAWL